MDKSGIMEEIKNLPKFELIEVGVRKSEEDAWDTQLQSRAVVFKDKTEAIAYVTTRYKLVQFSEVFMPIVESLENFKGYLKNYRGKCIMDLFPEQDEFKDNETRYGITAINSVDKSTSITIKFNVMVNGSTLCFPKSMAAFSKPHSVAGFNITKDYIKMISTVKDAWRNIVKHFPTIKIPKDDYDGILSNFSLGKTTRNAIKHNLKWKGTEYNLWDVVEMRLKEISGKEYKSEVHKSDALNKLCNEIFSYAVAAGI